jgi:hypothetical protein
LEGELNNALKKLTNSYLRRKTKNNCWYSSRKTEKNLLKTLPAKSRIRRGKEDRGNFETTIIKEESNMWSLGRRGSKNHKRDEEV